MAREIVTSENKAEYDAKKLAKKSPKKKEEKNKHEHLTASGFKELTKDYEWAKTHEMEDKTKHHFNVKHAGSPERYHVKRGISTPSITGASQKMGEYNTPEEVTAAVDAFMKSRQTN